MKEFSRQKVRTCLLEYLDYLSSKEKYVSITEWINGEGVDISWSGEDGHQIISLTSGDVAAFIAAYNQSLLPGKEEG